jgi:transposase-like protein
MNFNDITKFTQSEDKAREFLENERWPKGAICPHCGVEGESYRLKGKEGSKSPVRPGVWKCGGCRKQFTVKVGTIFEDSHIPLTTWLKAIHLLCASKKGMSAHQLHRMLGVTYKSAWFMAHRIRYAMTQEPLSSKLTGVVEIDETYVGGKFRTGPHADRQGQRPQDRLVGTANKAIVVSVLQRGGRVQSRHIDKVTARNLRPMIEQMVAENAHVMTDTSATLKTIGMTHKLSQVNHNRKEYVRREKGVTITTNTVEGYFSILKRGINGVYHHVGKQHLHRYLSEFDFRYNARKIKDGERAQLAIKGVAGKRLKLRDSRNLGDDS